MPRLYTLRVHGMCMSRTNIEARRKYGLRTKKEAVDLVSRRLVDLPGCPTNVPATDLGPVLATHRGKALRRSPVTANAYVQIYLPGRGAVSWPPDRSLNDCSLARFADPKAWQMTCCSTKADSGRKRPVVTTAQ